MNTSTTNTNPIIIEYRNRIRQHQAEIAVMENIIAAEIKKEQDAIPSRVDNFIPKASK